MARRGVIGHAGVHRGVVDAVEFKREKQEMRGNIRQLCLGIAIKLAVCRVRRIGKICEPGKGADAADQIVQRFIFLQRSPDALFARGLRGGFELSLPLLLESRRHRCRLLEITLIFR
ncbi:hypothetical protein D3C80_251120 [compost metagenome]